MRIEDDDSGAMDQRMETIRRIQDYQLEQARSEQTQDPGDTDAAAAQQRQEVDASIVASEQVQQANQAPTADSHADEVAAIAQRDGTQIADDAVRQASDQQDRGEAWNSFAQADDTTVIPPSVEEMRADEQAAERREEEERVRLRDLLNQMTIQSGQIRS